MNVIFAAVLLSAVLIFAPRWPGSTLSPPQTPTLNAQQTFPQVVDAALAGSYVQARTELARGGQRWIDYIDTHLGALIATYPGWLEYGTKGQGSLAIYWAGEPKGLVVVTQDFYTRSYFEPSWPLLFASVLVHEATHDLQYRRGEVFTKESYCAQELDAVRTQARFLDDVRSWVSSYYRTRILESHRAYCP